MILLSLENPSYRLLIPSKMELFVPLLFVLCGFRVLRYGCGLRIKGPEDKNITVGMTVPLECQSDRYGIVFEFTHRSTTQSVRIAECEFKKDNLSTAFFLLAGLTSAYNITQRSRTCILTILSLMEDQCGTYSCTELYNESEYIYCTIFCDGATPVTSTPGETNVQPDKGRFETLIGSILGVSAFIILIVCSLCLAYRKWRNTKTIPETGASTREREQFIPQETGQEQSVYAPVIAENIDVVYTEHDMIDDSTNTPSEEICENGADSMERVEEARDNFKSCYAGKNVDIPDNSISLNNQVAGPYTSPGIDDRNTDTENVPGSGLKDDSADSAEEEHMNAFLHNTMIVGIIQKSPMKESLKEEVLNVAKSGTFLKAKDKFDRKHFGQKLLDGQLKLSTLVLDE